VRKKKKASETHGLLAAQPNDAEGARSTLKLASGYEHKAEVNSGS